MNPALVDLIEHPTQLAGYLSAIVRALSQVERITRILRRLLPKNAGPRTLTLIYKARDVVAREFTPTWHWPFVNQVGRFGFCVTFYLLSLYCAVLFLLYASVTFVADVPLWKHGIGAVVTVVVALVARWQLIQADKLRRELRQAYGR